MHDLCENYVNGTLPEMPNELYKMRKYFTKLKAEFDEGKVILEDEWAYDSEWGITEWHANNVWLRVKLDALVLESETSAHVIDYKTGRKFGNELKHAEQLMLYAISTFIRYPQLEFIKVTNWYLDHNETLSRNYSREQAMLFINRWSDRATLMTTTTSFPVPVNIIVNGVLIKIPKYVNGQRLNMNLETTALVFDIETLDTNPTGIILSMGVVIFELDKVQSFDELLTQGKNIYFDQDEQKQIGRTCSDETLDWWSTQGEAASDCLDNPNKVPCKSLYRELAVPNKKVGFQPNRKTTRWFSRGYFDIAFMDNFCRSFELDPMLKFWVWRDTRTYLDALGLGSTNEKIKKPEGFIEHNSYHDSAYEAYMMQRLINGAEYEIEETDTPILPYKISI